MAETIERREQITPAWLPAALAAAGFKATVVDIEVEPIVVGHYGIGNRLAPRYEQEGGIRNCDWVRTKLQEHGAVERGKGKGTHRRRRDLAPRLGMMLH